MIKIILWQLEYCNMLISVGVCAMLRMSVQTMLKWVGGGCMRAERGKTTLY